MVNDSDSISKSKDIRKMEVIKRDGRREPVSFDKVTSRITGVCKKLGLKRINPVKVALDTLAGIYDGITTEDLDLFAANKCAEKIIEDTEYNTLAAGICISNIHKTTSANFMEVTDKLYNNIDRAGKINPLITKEYYDNVKHNINVIQSNLDYERDYLFDFFGVKTMEKAYLIRLLNEKIKSDFTSSTLKQSKKQKQKMKNISNELMMRQKYGRIVERPQHMIMRVALGIHGQDINAAFETYHLISNKYFTHASPTLYNAASPHSQLSSCFLLNIHDSIDGIFETVADVAKISKRAGGIGITISNIRARGSLIRGTNGNSDGIIPLAKLFNQEARYVNQGGRRKGAIALYIEPWHADVYDFISLRKNTGAEEMRARDIFLALWIPDLFMRRVLEGGKWSLMCPDECPGLTTVYGKEFEDLYLKYEREGRSRKVVNAEDLMLKIMESQIETGMPYMCYKDNVNNKSNQSNIGVVQCSNLCSEIVEYTSPDEIAVCNLASICLPRFIETDSNGNKVYNYQKLYEVAKVATKNLNKIIDINYYPVEKARYSNLKNRPIGVGVQGLGDVYCMLDLPFDSDEAIEINKKMFETIYFGCCEASMELSIVDGPYETYEGSPFSKGKLQWHLWGLTNDDLLMPWDWNGLIENIKKHGMRNSLLTAIMPTASTSQLMKNNECIECYTSNLYVRRTLAGEFIVVNRHLVEKLIDAGLWTEELREELLYDNGSIQKIKQIPDEIKAIYKTAFEMKTKPIIDQAVTRGPFIDQSQSLNLFIDKPNFNMLRMAHLYGWKKGLKTGLYYLRSKPAVDAIAFGLDMDSIMRIKIERGEEVDDYIGTDKNDDEEKWKDPRKDSEIETDDKIVDRRADNYEECEMCSG
jgi:ribonucleoside-diphosphate reductase alpha chain